LRKGVHLAEGVARVAELKARGRHSRGAELELVLTEGRNREIRRVLARVGHKVLRLRRIAMGPLKLGTLQPGESRRLTPAEVQALRHCVHDQKAQSKKHAPAIESEPLHLSDFDTGSNEEGRRPSPAARPRGAKRPPAQSSAAAAGRGPKRSERPGRSERPSTGRPSTGRPSTGRPSTGRPGKERLGQERPGRPGNEGRGGARPKAGAVLGYEPAPPTTDEPRPARPPRPPRPPRAPRQRTKSRPAKAAGRRTVGRKTEGKRRRPS
jgi:23S rRNA pseudouridine2605 synthase